MARHYPKDWFDLSQQKLADFGSMWFLAGLVQKYNQYKVAELMQLIEPPLRLGQYKIFTSKGYPRAFITWASLNEENQIKFALEESYFGADQWASGENIWLVDLVAPFGHGPDVQKEIIANMTNDEMKTIQMVRARRKPSEDKPTRISQWKRGNDGEVKFRSFTKEQFKKKITEVS